MGFSWDTREGKFTAPGGDNAAAAVERPESRAEGVYVWRCGVEAGSQGSLSIEGVTDKGGTEADVDKQEPDGVRNPDIDTKDGTEEEPGRAEETMADLDTVSVECRGDAGRGEIEDPADICLDPTGDISVPAEVGGLRPCTIRGGEETLGGAVEGGTDDASRGGVDSTLRDDITGGLEAEEGGPDTAGPPETLVRDGDTGAGDVDTDS